MQDKSSTRRGPLARAIVTFALLLGLSPAPAEAQSPDYRLESTAWNGLSELLAIGQSTGIRIDTSAEIDLATLAPEDALLILYPREDLPRASLASFLRAGGRIAIADDYGAAPPFLRLYGIERRDPGDLEGVPRLRGNPALRLAHPRSRHPLVEGVPVLASNHPQVLRHADLEPILAFDDGGDALVLAGAVERGRLVSIGDPSVLINNMLRFRGNRRFAENLFTYLEGGRGGRVFVVPPSVRLEGRYGGEVGTPVDRLRDWLSEAAHAEPPPLALTLTALVIVAILMVFAVSTLPLRSPYGGALLRDAGRGGGGFAGRVAFFARRKGNLVHPALVYKYELEGELTRRLGLEGRPLLKDVLAAARAAGLPERDREALRGLLRELDDLRRRVDLPPGPPRVTPRALRRMVDTGERILAALPPAPPSSTPRPTP
ncbi:MAG TPA: DUF4350 domain-containing protein [Polyangiaceae bacterium LLY-WYZ-15_(1-7)]|nr:hypothetical protein [Myxococcales bacterium]MAT29144.1 hypothetical protein [Sandaracinus sp.]MBJ74884.1 hypothetical protein [Sandaracinus sp.]HJL03399.1 DUF4350 domain-containing protein [Polyangiaceae bacterium LLY-WYZ-15_(1-7)]HJL13958.1 DUF4350 domain-containing protein [Polyangiaceae bacterium LLY-WYZ-15_(1-7)]